MIIGTSGGAVLVVVCPGSAGTAVIAGSGGADLVVVFPGVYGGRVAVGGRRGWLILVLWARLLGLFKGRTPLTIVAGIRGSPLRALTAKTTITQIMIAATGIITPMSIDRVELPSSP